ncbi:MAG TPA: hypothetical protein VHU84_11785 [Lacipirellulaceae bacterium]|jgi:flagellin|nr:hypothetical protein [Lacipirellulaceae bacterium]
MSGISINVRGADQQYIQSFQRNSDRVKTSVERLSTGKRINHPSDDPPGFVAAEGLRGELVDLNSKLKGIASQRRQSDLQQSGLQNIRTALDDLRGRVNSSADITLTSDERASLNSQIDNAAAEIDRVAKLTGNDSSVAIDAATAAKLANSGAATSGVIDQASQAVSQKQTTLAADEHANLDTFQQLYQDQVVITSDALSKIEDTDYAAETADLVQSQTMTAGAMAALSYSGRERVNQIKQVLDAIA